MPDGAAPSPEVPFAAPGGFYARGAKRALDVLVAALLLILAAPLLFALGWCVRARFGSPMLFRQERAGRNGVPFVLLKLRSMRSPAYPGEPDAARLDRFGRRLRASGLDELPQLINVLRGEMSLVGPRPLPTTYDGFYTPRERTRLRVRPGLLGLAQARGRNALDWNAKLEWDARYAGHVTFAGDVRAALGSLAVLIRGKGASAPGHATSPPLSERNGPGSGRAGGAGPP